MKKLFLFSIMVIAAILLSWVYINSTDVVDEARDETNVMAPFIDIDEVQPVGETSEDKLEKYQYRAMLENVAKSGGSGQAFAGYVSEYRILEFSSSSSILSSSVDELATRFLISLLSSLIVADGSDPSDFVESPVWEVVFVMG